MRTGRLIQLVGINVRRDLKGAALSALGVAAGIAALAFFVSLGRGVGEVVRTRIFPTDARLIEVVAPKVSVGLFGGVKLDEEQVKRLSATEGVEAVHRKMELRVPAGSRYDGQFFGKKLRMGVEILGVGVEPSLVSADIQPGAAFTDPGEGGAIPVLISSRLLEIYNKSFAKARGLPVLTPALLKGFEFPVQFGRSFVVPNAADVEVVRQGALLVGVSDRALLQGITLPLDAVKRLNARFGSDAETYTSVVLQAKSPDDVPRVTAAVRAAGFDIDDTEKRLAESVGAAVAITTLALALLSILITGLATVNIALTLGASVRSRAREIGVLRAVGATASDVARLVVGEAVVVGFFGGAIGAAAAFGAAKAVDFAATRYLPEFPFKPESFFDLPPWLLAAAVGVGVLASLIGAYPPARAAARLDPARAIGG